MKIHKAIVAFLQTITGMKELFVSESSYSIPSNKKDWKYPDLYMVEFWSIPPGKTAIIDEIIAKAEHSDRITVKLHKGEDLYPEQECRFETKDGSVGYRENTKISVSYYAKESITKLLGL